MFFQIKNVSLAKAEDLILNMVVKELHWHRSQGTPPSLNFKFAVNTGTFLSTEWNTDGFVDWEGGALSKLDIPLMRDYSKGSPSSEGISGNLEMISPKKNVLVRADFENENEMVEWVKKTAPRRRRLTRFVKPITL